MTHVEERLKIRYGITGVTPAKLKYYTLNYGEKIVDSKSGGTIYKLTLEGKVLFPVMRNGNVVTVYWRNYVDKVVYAEWAHNKKKLEKIRRILEGR